MKYMLDTNILIYAIKKKPPQVIEKLKEHVDNGLCISAITLAEMEHGIQKSAFPESNQARLMQFLSILQILPFNDKAAIEYGKICAYLQKKGTPIGTMDMLIAGHAKAERLPLITNNEREFLRIPGLVVKNWV